MATVSVSLSYYSSVITPIYPLPSPPPNKTITTKLHSFLLTLSFSLSFTPTSSSLSNGNHFLQLLHHLFLFSLPIPTSPPSSPLFTSNLHHHHPPLHHPHFKPLHSLSHHFHHLSQTSHHHPFHLKRWRKRRHRR